jgi:hypothetical protein
MNINTNSLLTALAPKLTTTTKSVIENLSKDGKVDINSLLKNPKLQSTDIKSLLSGLLKDLGTGAKTKETVSQLLQNSKKIFDFKSLSSDVKSILTHIKDDPKLQKQVAVLKQFQTNIKNLDQKSLKSNISNSGVFLESKLTNKPEVKPLPYNVKVALEQIKQSQDKIDTATKSIKNIIKNLLEPAKTTTKTQNTNIKSQTMDIKNTQNLLKSTQNQKATTIANKSNTNLLNSNTTTLTKTIQTPVNKMANLTQTATTTQNTLPNIKTQQTVNISQNQTTQNLSNTLKSTPNLQTMAKSPEITTTTMLKNPIIDTKPIVASLKNLVTSLQSNPKLEPQITTLKTIISNLETLDKNPTLRQNENTNLLKAKVLNTISTPLDKIDDTTKEIKAQAKNLSTNNNKNISNDAKTLLSQVQDDPKLAKQTTVIKEFIVSKASQQAPQQTQPAPMAKVQNDIKATLLQVQEQLEFKGADTPKEVKAQVEKALNQIEFYQLSSFSTQSNHTYLPFSWEDMEDGDVKFHNSQKDTFSCHIGLKLKEKGEFKAMLLLDNKNNLNINLSIENDEFKAKLQENLQLLRKGISDIGLSLESLNVLSLQDSTAQTYEQKAYQSNKNLSFGVNLKA